MSGFGYELVLMACLLAQPSTCETQRYPFEAENEMPTVCAAYAMSIIPKAVFRQLHGAYQVRQFCRRTGQFVRI